MAEPRAPGAGPRAAGLARHLFLLLHAALAAAVLLWAAGRHRAAERDSAPPRPRSEPIAVAPIYDDPSVVSDEDLVRVLRRLRLDRRRMDADVGRLDHALRLWGAEATFGDEAPLDGSEMVRILLDHHVFRSVFGKQAPALLLDRGPGVAVRSREGPLSSPHVDHTLATLLEAGLPLATRVRTASRETSLAALVEGSLRSFSLNQREYEWSALAYALLLPPIERWVTSEGQEVTFDRLAERIRRQRLPDGVCSGHHRLYTLTVFLRIDDRLRASGEGTLLGEGARRRTLEFLAAATRTLEANRHADGFWNGDWPFAAPAARAPSGRPGDTLADRLTATGHALEWWALAPAEAQPDREVVRSAAAWLMRRLDAFDDEAVLANYSYLSHAARALAMWRGELPAAADSRSPIVAAE